MEEADDFLSDEAAQQILLVLEERILEIDTQMEELIKDRELVTSLSRHLKGESLDTTEIMNMIEGLSELRASHEQQATKTSLRERIISVLHAAQKPLSLEELAELVQAQHPVQDLQKLTAQLSMALSLSLDTEQTFYIAKGNDYVHYGLYEWVA